MLETLADLGPVAPPWMIARWIVSQSYGWMLLNKDPRTDAAVRMTMACCYAIPTNFNLRNFRELGTRIGSCDWVAHQLATFDLGGLGDFLEVVADDQFIAKVPMIGEWLAAPLRAYQYESIDNGLVHVSDVTTGERHQVLNLSCLEGSSLGAYVLGRVVPALPGGERMFASRPLEVDERTAQDATVPRDDPMFPSWLVALSEAFRDGRQKEGFGCRAGSVFSDSPAQFPCAS